MTSEDGKEEKRAEEQRGGTEDQGGDLSLAACDEFPCGSGRSAVQPRIHSLPPLGTRAGARRNTSTSSRARMRAQTFATARQ